jgi:integrase/recombinase XerD
MQRCEIEEPIGLRDRAILEVLYSTGLRRMEMIALKLYDLSLDRGLLLVRQGKGHKDRYTRPMNSIGESMYHAGR